MRLVAEIWLVFFPLYTFLLKVLKNEFKNKNFWIYSRNTEMDNRKIKGNAYPEYYLTAIVNISFNFYVNYFS